MIGFIDLARNSLRAMDTQHRLGIRLKSIRKQRGITQEKLAEQIGRSVDAVSNLERGKSLPSFPTIERLCDALDVELKVLFDFDEAERSAQRVALTEKLRTIADALSIADLELAVEQLSALSRRQKHD